MPIPGAAIGAAIDVILPVACAVLQDCGCDLCDPNHCPLPHVPVSGEAGERNLGLADPGDGTRLDLCHWENAIGRGRWADVNLDFPTVSRSHAALLRDDKGAGSSSPCDQKRHPLNGKKVTHTVPLKTGDIIDLGGIGLEFYAISETEERSRPCAWEWLSGR